LIAERLHGQARLSAAIFSADRIAAAHRGDGKRFVVRADEKLTAFVELEFLIRM